MLVVPAYAKVNLALEVTRLRPDGWHDIASVVTTVDWHDLVGIGLRCGGPAAGPPVRLRISGPFAEGIPADGTNLAVRAAAALLSHGGGDLAFDIWLGKNVPAAAGLGGGSADAAAVLRAGSALLGAAGKAQAPDTQHLVAAAEALGSDVPALLAGGTLMVTGRGELLEPLPSPQLHLAIAVAAPSMTAAAYGALHDDERRGDGRAARLAAALQHPQGPTTIDHATLGSALEAPAVRAAPGLADALRRLRAATPDHTWHLTGSGGAAFSIAATRQQAEHLAATARAEGFPARACRTVTPRLGPLAPP
ncbi:MAG TPA: hypothetical protein VGQ42_00525 [Candidatus Dormibacteraeota bacterium]|jgi:4-diphosphocytidyl-2-C-methyl-D-erythritol kinase|nr:hypothetical protein [Candidatus Dormibacteraeota bacterium]